MSKHCVNTTSNIGDFYWRACNHKFMYTYAFRKGNDINAGSSLAMLRTHTADTTDNETNTFITRRLIYYRNWTTSRKNIRSWHFYRELQFITHFSEAFKIYYNEVDVIMLKNRQKEATMVLQIFMYHYTTNHFTIWESTCFNSTEHTDIRVLRHLKIRLYTTHNTPLISNYCTTPLISNYCTRRTQHLSHSSCL